MKSYTDLEQSKKLAEILPLESADMCYINGDVGKISNGEWGNNVHDEDDIPCWSLVALLNIIPKHIKDYNVLRIDISTIDFAIWYDEIDCGVNNELPDITADNPVDACYEMIIRLNELKML